MNQSIEERLYKCFEKIANEENGKLIYPLNQSGLVADSFGNACVSEFLEECYQRWLVNHQDKYIETNKKDKQKNGHWTFGNGILYWKSEE